MTELPEEIHEALDRFTDVFGRKPDPNDETDREWLVSQVPPDVYRRALDLYFSRTVESVLHERVIDGSWEVAGVSEDGQLLYRAVKGQGGDQ